jgi:hypothetical protein
VYVSKPKVDRRYERKSENGRITKTEIAHKFDGGQKVVSRWTGSIKKLTCWKKMLQWWLQIGQKRELKGIIITGMFMFSRQTLFVSVDEFTKD